MKHVKLYEGFSIENYEKLKKEKEIEFYQRLGSRFIADVIKKGDFEGLKYLTDNGFDISKANTRIMFYALKQNQLKMFEHLLKNYKSIDKFPITEISSEYNYDQIITDKDVKLLKLLFKYDYDFVNNFTHLTDPIMKKISEFGKQVTGKRVLKEGVDVFIDWLLERRPQYYVMLKGVKIPDWLKEKYKHLDKSINYNI